MSQSNSKNQENIQEQFYPVGLNNYKASSRQKAKNKVGAMIQKTKQHKLQSQNNSNNSNSLQFTQEKRNNSSKDNPFIKYNAYLKNKRMPIKQLINHNQKVGLVIHEAKIRGISMGQRINSFNLAQIKLYKINQESSYTIRKKKVYQSNSEKKIEAISPTFSQRQFVQLNNKKEIFILNEPERNQKRQILFKKTIILSLNQSCLFQLSLLQDKLLIVAYLMGIQNKCIKQILNPKKTQAIMKEYSNNLDQFCSRISIQQINNQYQIIKIATNLKLIPKQQISNQDKVKEQLRVQKQFLKRNYYNLCQHQKYKSQSNKEQNTISNYKAQEIVKRLVRHKKYFNKQKQKQCKIDFVCTQQQKHKQTVQSKININIQNVNFAVTKKLIDSTFPLQLKQDTMKTIPQRYVEKKIKISLKRTDSVSFQNEHEQNAKSSQINSFPKESGKETAEVVHSDQIQKNKEQSNDKELQQQLLVFQDSLDLPGQIINLNDQELLHSPTKKVQPIQLKNIDPTKVQQVIS